MSAKLPPGTLEKLWSDSANWRAHFIYHCKADPRFMVPKRNRWAGWTVNFAHRAAWIYLVVGIGLTLARGVREHCNASAGHRCLCDCRDRRRLHRLGAPAGLAGPIRRTGVEIS
jgi:hypothetical protein